MNSEIQEKLEGCTKKQIKT